MCGRFGLFHDIKVIQNQIPNLYIPKNFKVPFGYNFGPKNNLPILLQDNNEQLKLQNMNWTLVPSWAKEINKFSRTFNARLETITEKASYKYLINKNRGVLFISGFYEWSSQKKKEKEPYFFSQENQEIIFLPVIWDKNHKLSEMKKNPYTFSIITKPANKSVSHPKGWSYEEDFHHRMPVHISYNDIPYWLNINEYSFDSFDFFKNTLHYQSQRVSTFVNNIRHQGIDCLNPVGEKKKLKQGNLF